MNEAFVATMDAIANKFGVPIEEKVQGSRCLLFEGAMLGALVAPERHEIEVWLTVPGHEPETFWSGDLRAALPSAPAPLMFNFENYQAALERLRLLFEQAATELLERRDQFLACLTAAHRAALENEDERSLRLRANAAWDGGEQTRAAALYKQLRNPTPSELKKIDLAERRNG